MNTIVDNIEKAVRVGILDALEGETRPQTLSALVSRVDAAADISDVETATRRLVAERLLVRHGNTYRMPATGADALRRARDAGPQRPARRPTDCVQAALEAAGDWLSVEALEIRIAELSREQIVGALKAARFARRRDPGDSGRAYQYGLAQWQAASGETPQTIADRVRAVISDTGDWLLITDIAQATGLPKQQAQRAIHALTARGELVAARSAVPRQKCYGLPGWARPEHARRASAPAPKQPACARTPEPPAAEPAAAPDPAAAPGALRCGLYSDGVLVVEAGAGALALAPAETRALVAYLVRQRSQITHIFDAAPDGAAIA